MVVPTMAALRAAESGPLVCFVNGPRPRLPSGREPLTIGLHGLSAAHSGGNPVLGYSGAAGDSRVSGLGAGGLAPL